MVLQSLLLILTAALGVVGVRVTPEVNLAFEGESCSTVDFYCRNDDNTFARDITWIDPYNNSYVPGHPGMNPRLIARDSKLTIINIIRCDAGIYRCQRTSMEYDEASLEVYAAPSILNDEHIQEIIGGETSVITCEVDRGNPLATIYWLTIQQNSSHFTEITDPRFRYIDNGLEINNVQKTDARTYQCYVYNRYGTVFLDILAAFVAPPEFVDTEIELIYILLEGTSHEFDCKAVGVPPPQYTWNVTTISWMSEQIIPLNTSKLTINFIDSTKYIVKCTASNEHGSISWEFILLRAVPPVPVTEFATTVLQHVINTNLTIENKVNAFPPPVFIWFKKYYSDDDYEPISNSFMVSKQQNETALSTLTYYINQSDILTIQNCTIYFLCTANNTFGESNSTFVIDVTNANGGNCLESTTEMTSKEFQKYIIIIVICFISTVAIILLIIVLVIRIVKYSKNYSNVLKHDDTKTLVRKCM